MKKNITDAEMNIMKILWDCKSPLTSKEIMDKVTQTEWKLTTLVTLLGKLIDKGFVSSEKVGRKHAYIYTPLVSEEDYKSMQTQIFVSNIHKGSYKSLINTLINDDKLTSNDLEELQQFIEGRKWKE